MKYFLSIGFLISVLSACASNTTVAGDNVENESLKNWTRSYQQGLEYESFFRHLSARGFGGFAEKTNDPYHRQAWSLWQQLERRSAEVMAPIRVEQGVPLEPSWSARFSARMLTGALRVIPETTLKQVEKSAHNFIPELEAIKATGPEEDQHILDFMIDHEKTLIRFLELYNTGNREEALLVFSKKLKEIPLNGVAVRL